MCGEENPSEPELFNVNKAAYDYFYRKKLRDSPELLEKHKFLLYGLGLVNTSASGGWIGAGSQSGGVKQIIERVVGKDMSNEDTRDFIDFCESYGLMDVKRNPDGSISAVKLLYANPQDGSDRIDLISKDESFYSGAVPEPTLENYESDSVLEQQAFAVNPVVSSSGVSVPVANPTRVARVRVGESRERYLELLPRVLSNYDAFVYTLGNAAREVWLLDKYQRVDTKIRDLLIPSGYAEENAERLGKRYRYVNTLISHLKQDIRNRVAGNASARLNFRKQMSSGPVKVHSYSRGGK
jgi:hypothetical protein